jgi:5-methylcytosine-specific restriction endonuclease McrA
MGKRKYMRHASLSIDEGFNLMASGEKTTPYTNADNRTVNVQIALRPASIFLSSKSVQCAACPKVGNMFAIEKTYGYVRKSVYNDWHINLYSVDEFGRETMMTVDHVVAKSNGGADDESNMQVMCSVCNSRKGKMSMEHFMHAKRTFHTAGLDDYHAFRLSIEDRYGINELSPDEYGELLELAEITEPIAHLDDERRYKLLTIRGKQVLAVWSISKKALVGSTSSGSSIKSKIRELQGTPPAWVSGAKEKKAKEIYEELLTETERELCDIMAKHTTSSKIAEAIKGHPMQTLLFARWSGKDNKLSMTTWAAVKKKI